MQINGLTLQWTRPHFALRRLVCGERTWFDSKPGASIWQLHVADARGRRVTLDCTAGTARFDGTALQWRNVHDKASGAGPFDVTVTIRPFGKNLTAWRINVRNRSRHWTLWHVVFPQLNGLASDKAQLFWPEVWGRTSAATTEVAGPCGGYGKHSMQFMGLTRGSRTFYFGAHDPGQATKQMVFKPGQMHFLVHPTGMTVAGNSYEQPYDVVVGEVAGDWYDAAKLYAGFARAQSWASRVQSEDREVLVWEQGSINQSPSDRIVTINGKPPGQWIAQMKALRRRLGVKMAVHMYQWHQTTFDTNYPEYFPVKRGFQKVVDELQADGIAVVPYINGRLWDQNAPSYDARAERAALKCCAERVNPRQRIVWPETYGNGQISVTMCLHTGFWRDTVVELCRRIVQDLGCAGVYLDQLGCSGGRTCIDPRHGHPPGGGTYWLDGQTQLLAAIRHAIGPEPLLTTENNWEACVAGFDSLLDTEWNHENNLPIFPAVFWGRGVIHGGGVFEKSFNNGGDEFIQRMGMRFVWGGQFGWGHFEWLLKPRHRELLDYFLGLCRLRTEYRRYFCRGEFLRPPVAGNPLKGPVLAAKWRDPDGPGAAIFLVNVTRKPVRARWSGGEEHLRPLEARAILEKGR